MQTQPGKNALNTVLFSVAGNAVMAVLKLLAGLAGNSFALVADAMESVSDVLSSVLVFFGLKYASRPADQNHPYGHGRIEPLLTFTVVGFLVISATLIARESIHNIQTPHGMPAPWTLWFLGAVILLKEGLFQFVTWKNKSIGSSSLRADAWHHRSDAITSLAAFAGISLAVFAGDRFEKADDWAALFAAGIIVFSAFNLSRPAFGHLMDEQIYDGLVAVIRGHAAAVEGVSGIEKCFIRKYGLQYSVDVHVLVDGKLTVAEGHAIAHRFKDSLTAAIPAIAQVLVHIEPDDPSA